MHPKREELQAFLEKKLVDRTRLREIQSHIEGCEFCEEFCDSYRQLTDPLDVRLVDQLPEKLQQLAESLSRDSLRGSIIDLIPLASRALGYTTSTLAADGRDDASPTSANFFTLCSEDPEILLRIMRDPDRGGDYLQLLTADEQLAAHVMVRLPDLNREFVTDAEGHADLDLTDAGDLEQLKWQIKIPDAVFELKPLKYDPNNTEYVEEVTLETDRHDLIEIRFEGKTEGKQLSIKVVKLDGRPDYEPIQVTVTQQDNQRIQTITPGRAIDFGPIDSNTTINIRLYQ